MKGLLVVERFVLETIGKRDMGPHEIMEETKLNMQYLNNILTGLVKREILELKEFKYYICENRKVAIFKELNKKENIKGELRELFSSFVNEFYQEQKEKADLNIKKVNLDKFEEKLLKVHMHNLSKFINDLSKKKSTQISEQKVVMWGECNYLNLVNQSLEAV